MSTVKVTATGRLNPLGAKVEYDLPLTSISAYREHDGHLHVINGEYKGSHPLQLLVCDNSFTIPSNGLIKASSYQLDGEKLVELSEVEWFIVPRFIDKKVPYDDYWYELTVKGFNVGEGILLLKRESI